MAVRSTPDSHPLDLLGRVSNAGALKATASLSALAGKPIESSFPLVRIVPLDEIPTLMGDPEQVIAGVVLDVSGDVTGRFIVVFPIGDAFALIHTLTGIECDLEGGLDEMAMSAVCEVGNILASSYLTALEELTGLAASPSPPCAALDMAAAVLTTAVLPLHEAGSEILFVEARFGQGCRDLGGRMVLLPSADSLTDLLRAVQARE